jgi:hypothetical protein
MTLPLASSRGASLKGVGSGGLTVFLINTHSCFLLMREGCAASQTSAYPAHSRKQTQRVSHVRKNKNTRLGEGRQEKEKKEATKENKVKDGEKGKLREIKIVVKRGQNNADKRRKKKKRRKIR